MHYCLYKENKIVDPKSTYYMIWDAEFSVQLYEASQSKDISILVLV